MKSTSWAASLVSIPRTKSSIVTGRFATPSPSEADWPTNAPLARVKQPITAAKDPRAMIIASEMIRFIPGTSLIVKVHHGFFGLPWYVKILPE
jgi:hypothetical protein